ncbi:hypothetical protein SLS62_011163 [Diatrype stigma]|uniref:Alpha,alpha-trehalase n=1 Tax=Diatrype stigma TaxID=117547 RepID=A0AAN9YG13_9PEZI
MATALSVLGILFLLVIRIFAQSPSRPAASPARGVTSFLDKDVLLGGFFGQTFLKDNVPLLDIPDQLVQDVYYYRWTSLQRNLRYVMHGAGWMCTEFVHPVWYASTFGTIDAAAGHHIDEARWLRTTDYADDYIQLYTRGPANSLQYTQWIADAMSRQSMVTGNQELFAAQLDNMINMWHEWDPYFDEAVGLYYYQPVWDAQELSLPGFIADPNNTDWDLRKDGPDTFRPNHNAYMVANARAIARAAKLTGNEATEATFGELANTLEAAIFRRMWAPEQEFFMDIIRPGNPNLTRLTGREQVGLFPYRFGIGLDESHAQPAVDALFDPDGFLSPYGPTTLERRDPWFMAEKEDPSYCCYWNGMSWPFSTSHTLKSLAAIYRAGNTNVTAEQYYQYLQTYARTQQKNGQPYVAESHYPLRDAWSADTTNHSEHYDHSTNNDDVITGLLGLLPQPDDSLVISPIVPDNWTYFGIENVPYHGHLVTVLYDEDGSRYRQGSGLTVFVNGDIVYHNEDSEGGASKNKKQATIPIPPFPGSGSGSGSGSGAYSRDGAPQALVNIAANPSGPGHQYPQIEATYTNAADYHYKAIDGVLYYDDVPDNRWTNVGSPHANDTLTLTFARPRNVSSVTLALLSNVDRGGAVDLPARVEVYDGRSGRRLAVVDEDSAGQLLPNDRNEIVFDGGEAVETTSIAVNLYRRSDAVYVGVCELEVWVPPETGPAYRAVDAYLTGTSTRVGYYYFDDDNDSYGFTTTATATGAATAVVGGLAPDSVISFPGVIGPGGDGDGTSVISVRYGNSGNVTVVLGVEVNHVPIGSVSLPPTTATTGRRRRSSSYGTATVEGPVKLGRGKNWVNLVNGTDAIWIETLAVT